MTAPAPDYDREMLLSRFSASGQWDRLLATASEWLADDPENAGAHLRMAEALINLDRYAEAERHLSHALARFPENATAHRWMSMVQFDLKNFRAADKAIHDAIALDPEDAESLYHLAWMCHQHHDLKNALKWAMRARELAPESSHVLNLCAMCTGQASQDSALLEDALALDPENAFAINNLGVDHLNASDYVKAEECFRNALTLQPTLKVARQNLFITIKHRDPVYRILCAPRDFLIWLRVVTFGDEGKKRNVVVAALGLLAWLLIFKLVIVGLIFWLGLVWPMVKFYEFLVVGDLRRKAGEIGATRGGFFGYRRWSVRTRMALFAVALGGFWTAFYLFTWSPSRSTAQRETAARIFLLAVLAGMLIYFGRRAFHGSVSRYHAWRRERMLRRLDPSEQ